MSPPFRIVLHQAGLALAVMAGMMLVSTEQARAALIAAVVCIVPNAYFAWRSSVERSPARLLAQGVAKFVVTVSLMAAAFAVWKPAPLGFFAAFIAMQLMYVTGSLGAGSPERAAAPGGGGGGGIDATDAKHPRE